MRLFAKIDNGVYESFTRSDDTARPPVGYVEVPIDSDLEDLRGRVYVAGQAPGAKVPAVRTRLTKLEFRELFTRAERDALRVAIRAIDDDLEDAREAFEVAEFIDLADPRLGGYLALLETKRILAVGRIAEILAGVVPR